MIILITHTAFNEKTNKNETLVSHGINYQTDKVIILPCEPINFFPDAEFNQNLGEYVIYENKEEKALYSF